MHTETKWFEVEDSVPSLVSRTLQNLQAYRMHPTQSVFENTTACASMLHIVGTCMQTFLGLCNWNFQDTAFHVNWPTWSMTLCTEEENHTGFQFIVYRRGKSYRISVTLCTEEENHSGCQ
jgi:hypothetical protein